MNILVVAHHVPMPDRQAGMLRFSRLLAIFAEQYHVRFFATQRERQVDEVGEVEVTEYTNQLYRSGINFMHGGDRELTRLLRRERYDVVFFEHYQFSLPFLDEIRFWSPRSKIVIDSIDINYERLMSKARLSRASVDFEVADRVKRSELSAYARSDVVIAISEQDKCVLESANPQMNVEVVPLIYPLQPLRPRPRRSTCNLLFVGNFEHPANVDAVLYFCGKVLPLLKSRLDGVRLSIIGNAPNAAVRALADNDVEVLGFVRDLKPHYEQSDISIAPITWGGGLKGKIAEAMCYGLPVVTTSVGIDGFGLTPGKNVVIGDNAEDFAEGLVRLQSESSLYEQIRREAWEFIDRHYGVRAVREQLEGVMTRLRQRAPRSVPVWRRLKHKLPVLLDTHVLWRFRRG